MKRAPFVRPGCRRGTPKECDAAPRRCDPEPKGGERVDSCSRSCGRCRGDAALFPDRRLELPNWQPAWASARAHSRRGAPLR